MSLTDIQARVAATTPKAALAPTAMYAYEGESQLHHYFKHADTYVKMGESMGEAMLSLL